MSNTTKGRIPELVTPSLVAGARMVLANAAFFKGVWLYQFKKSATSKGLFYSNFEDYSFVDMMRQKGNFRYGTWPSDSYRERHLLPFLHQSLNVSVLYVSFYYLYICFLLV